MAASVADLRARGVLPATPDKAAGVLLQWPLRAAAHVHDPGVHGISNFVDQNTAYPNQLLDYNCGARTYDQSGGYNHQGTDIFIWPFAWHKVDDDDVEIVAGAPGVIISKSDGNYDRNCSFGGGSWNAVYVQHADGSIAWYGHMKNGSTTGKVVGQSVAAGEYLGIVGSSGNSTGPHLHLELYDNLGNLVDPWAGSCNSRNADSWWADQRPYYDSAINALRTHDAPPVWQTCPQPATINAQDQFTAGQLVYFAAYYRDQLQGQLSTYEVLRPDGSVWQQWTGSLSGVPHYAASWWYWSWYLPADAATGMWTFRVSYEGQVATHRFAVGDVSAVPEATGAGLALLAPAPNPFNPSTTVSYTLAEAGPIELTIHDLQGRKVATLLSADQAAASPPRDLERACRRRPGAGQRDLPGAPAPGGADPVATDRDAQVVADGPARPLARRCSRTTRARITSTIVTPRAARRRRTAAYRSSSKNRRRGPTRTTAPDFSNWPSRQRSSGFSAGSSSAASAEVAPAPRKRLSSRCSTAMKTVTGMPISAPAICSNSTSLTTPLPGRASPRGGP